MLYSFDASSIIHFYDNYPIENPHLAGLWDWFAERMDNGDFVISRRAYDEVIHKTDGLPDWFNEINIFEDTIADLEEAQIIKDLLEIEEEEFHPKGVGENDIFIISISKRLNSVLVSNESQINLPGLKKKYKIPSVCSLPEIDIECINIADLLRRNP